MKKTMTMFALLALCTCCFARSHHSGLRSWEKALLITNTVLTVANTLSSFADYQPVCTYPAYTQPIYNSASVYAPAPVYVNSRPVIVTPPRPHFYFVPAFRPQHYSKPVHHYNNHFGKPVDRRQPRRK